MVSRDSFTQMTAGSMSILVLCLVFLSLLTSCASSPTVQTQKEILYVAPQPATIKKFHTPAFLIKEPEEQYNKIGMPSVREVANHKPEIYVAPDKPAIFFETQKFTTAKGTYKNLIYRIHFEQVPFALGKFNLTAGNNPGILIIYTLDAKEQLLLVTTVNTCGCFLAFFPTKALPDKSFPADWPIKSQWVYGYNLPSLLQPNQPENSERIVFTLESETHRISDVVVSEQDTLQKVNETIDMGLFSMDYLYQLPFKDNTESFFEMDGARKGYVRNNIKILERLFISWWAFDLHVGEDKAYGSADTSETIFYTSLKFWDRKSSDLKNFPAFFLIGAGNCSHQHSRKHRFLSSARINEFLSPCRPRHFPAAL